MIEVAMIVVIGLAGVVLVSALLTGFVMLFVDLEYGDEVLEKDYFLGAQPYDDD